MTNTCVNCKLVITYDTDVPDAEKYVTWDGMWRSVGTGSLSCASDDAHMVEVGYPRQVYRLHDPVQQFLVTFHKTGGSTGEAVEQQEQWVTGSRLDAIGLKNAVSSACVAVGMEDFWVRIVPLGVEVSTPGPTHDWAGVVAKFSRDQYLDEYREDED